jgi:hypothetical protein
LPSNKAAPFSKFTYEGQYPLSLPAQTRFNIIALTKLHTPIRAHTSITFVCATMIATFSSSAISPTYFSKCLPPTFYLHMSNTKHSRHAGSSPFSSAPSPAATIKITHDECHSLYQHLGDHVAIPKLCRYSEVNRNSEQSLDMTLPHHNSWLWPKLARRATSGSGKTGHPSEAHWHNYTIRDVVVTEQECNNLMVALQKQLGLHHATHALPVKCRGAIIDNAG